MMKKSYSVVYLAICAHGGLIGEKWMVRIGESKSINVTIPTNWLKPLNKITIHTATKTDHKELCISRINSALPKRKSVNGWLLLNNQEFDAVVSCFDRLKAEYRSGHALV